ncbi:unnamed protein product [Cuscuta campestris]|uniref:Transposase (putative) gypsy type domain-containing protein n=1 Tax=Cuscuta campestris TaxID=132261 RepID=A0A484MM09_9ASTE|nr:unnamed protein product [Cuscuta campestris]
MASSDSTPIPVVDPAATCFEEMYRQDPSLRPDGVMGGIDHSRVLSAVPLRTSVTVASSSRAPRLKGKKSKTVKNQTWRSSPVTVLETGLITSTGCLLLDIDFDEALRFVGEGYSVHRPHATNHVFSVTSPDAEVGVHVASMRYGLQFPPHDLIVQFLNFYRLLPGQLSPHSYYFFSIFLIECHLKGVPWSLDFFRYMFKVSKVGEREGNSYAVVSSQDECGMAVIPTSLKLWKPKFVFISGFPGDRHPFQARFPDCHTFIRHPRTDPTPELLAHAQKLLEGFRPKLPHVYMVCTEQNLAEVRILISLERQFELAEAVLGSRPKHGLEESTSRSEDPESEEREEEEDEEIETDEESGQPSYSEDVADVEPSGGHRARDASRGEVRGVVRLQGLLKESEESTSQLTASMAELEGRLRQSEGRILELDVELDGLSPRSGLWKLSEMGPLLRGSKLLPRKSVPSPTSFMETMPSSSQTKTVCRPPPSPPEDAESRTCSWWYRAKKLERRIECLQRLVNYLHVVPQRPATPVEVAQPAADAIPAGDNHPEESVGSS